MKKLPLTMKQKNKEPFRITGQALLSNPYDSHPTKKGRVADRHVHLGSAYRFPPFSLKMSYN